MTANAFEDDRRACLDAGMNDHLAKPVDPDRLYATLERWIPAKRTPAAGREPGSDGQASEPGAQAGVPPVDVEAVLGALRGLPGVDTTPWLGGSPAARVTYVDLLVRFAVTHGGDARTVRSRLDAGQVPRAARIVRTLERVAGGLGLVEIEQVASGLQAALDASASGSVVSAAVDALAAALAQLLADLARAGVAPQAAPDPVAG